MYYYSEPVRREPNRRGKPRLVTVLGELSGAVHHGFDGDGQAPERGQESGRVRLWEFAGALDELPDGVVKLTKTVFTKVIADREAAKPVPPPEPEPIPADELPLSPEEQRAANKALRTLIAAQL